jgi:hypothetical protein
LFAGNVHIFRFEKIATDGVRRTGMVATLR